MIEAIVTIFSLISLALCALAILLGLIIYIAKGGES
jgi:hypothetical protein